MDKKKFREHTKEEKYQFRDTFHTFKFQEMTSVKKESQKNQLRKTSYEKKVLENNLAKANFIKKQLLIGNLKVEEYKTNKLLKVKREYEHKINDEKSLTKKSEFDIIEMEKMELELIRNLQQSQYLQKTVYEELEGALTLPLIDFENKYKMKNNTEENEKKMTKKRKKKKTVGDFNQLKVKINNFKF